MGDSGRYAYPVDLISEPEGGFTVLIPDLKGAVTYGETREEALVMAADCAEEAIAATMKAGEDVACPSPAHGRPTVTPGALTAAKAALYAAMRERAMTKSALADRLGLAEGEVRRMLDPRHATRIGRIEDALAVLGRRIVLEVREAS